MAYASLTERGDCLRDLGRLDQAVGAYEEGISRAEKVSDAPAVGVGKKELGTVRLLQGRHADALQAYNEALELFTRLDHPKTVAAIWHQTGMVYQETGQAEAAEDAYRKSLTITVRLKDVGGQATTLNQLGGLYDDFLRRSEEAVTFYRQAADKYVQIGDIAGEGRARNNLAVSLRQLGRLDDARREVLRAIECKAQLGHVSEVWTTWDNLANIETDAGNPAAAREARRKAIGCYLAYRRDGGENRNIDGFICPEVSRCLLAGDLAAAASLLQGIGADPRLPARARPLIHALQTIVDGSRDRSLADTPELPYRMAAEILLLLENLETSH